MRCSCRPLATGGSEGIPLPPFRLRFPGSGGMIGGGKRRDPCRALPKAACGKAGSLPPELLLPLPAWCAFRAPRRARIAFFRARHGNTLPCFAACGRRWGKRGPSTLEGSFAVKPGVRAEKGISQPKKRRIPAARRTASFNPLSFPPDEPSRMRSVISR